MNYSLNQIDPCTFTGSAVLIGLILAKELNYLEQDSVGNWLQLIGLTIQTYQSQQAVVDQKNNTDQKDLDAVKRAIEKINEELKKIK